MYSVSQNFKNAILSTSRILKAKVVINNNTYDETYIASMTLEDTSNPSGSFEIGSVASPLLTLSLISVNEVFETASIKPYIGLDLGGTVEYVPLGVFYVDDVGRKKDVVTLTCYDGMIKLEKAYFSDLNYPAAITAVMNEICTKAGIQFTGTLPNYSFPKKPEGYTYREVVAFIAQMCGGFAKFDRDGKLRIKSYASISETITADSYVDFSKTKDQAFRIDKVTCQVDDKTISKGTLSVGGSEVTFENPFMTDAILTDVYNKLKGFQYIPIDLQYVGNPAYDVGDIVTLVTIDIETYSIPIMSHKLSYSGGLTGEIQSIGETENSNQFGSSGSVSKTVERVVYEQALIKEALIDKATIEDLEATNAEIENLKVSKADIEDLNAVNATIQNLQANKADIEDLNAANARIDNLEATKANITDLNATNARVGALEADVGSINTLLAGNLGAENFRAGAIYAGSGVIAQGAIGDAEISNLNASKINAGILNTALVTIQGANGRLKMSGNRLQVFANKTDGSLYERVSLGDVNGDGSVYGLRVRGADGQTVLLDENGVKREGITDGSITNDKIADDANISGTKLDIASVVTEINEGTTTIQSSKIFYNGKTLDIQLGTMQTTINNQGQTITNHETRITATEQGLATKVSVSQYQQDQAALSSQLSQMNTQIQQQANQIALKADAVNVYTKSQIDGQFTTVNTQISNLSAQLSVQADQIATKVSRTEFESLQIGGRNLYFNSADFAGWQGYNVQGAVVSTDIPLKNINAKSITWKVGTISNTGGYYQRFRNDNGNTKFTNGQVYTVSAWAKASADATLTINVEGISGASKNFNLTTNWRKIQLTFTGNGSAHTITFYGTDSSKSITFYLALPKLEEGNRATDWSPAPEDVQGQIDGLGSRMTTAETSITQLSNQIALKANQSTVDNLTGQVSSLQAQLTVQADQIATKVEKNGVISAINQTAEQIKIQASKVDLAGYVTFTNLSTPGQTTIDGGNLKTGSVTTDKIAAKAITADKLNVTSLDAISANLGTINAGTINGVTINSSKFYSENNFQGPYYYTRQNIKIEKASITMETFYDDHPANERLWSYINPDYFQIIRKRNNYNVDETKIEDAALYLYSRDHSNGALQADLQFYVSEGGPVVRSSTGPIFMSQIDISAPNKHITLTENDQVSYKEWHIEVNNGALNFVETDVAIRMILSSETVTVNAGLDVSSDIEFSGLQGRIFTDTGANVGYIQTTGNEWRATKYKSTTYVPVRASSFPTGSLAEYKEDIHPWQESALEKIRQATIYEYYLKSELEQGIYRKRQGLVVGEGYNTPDGVIDGDGVEQYLMNAWSWKAIQELDSEQQSLKDRIAWLELENQYLKQKIQQLEAMVS